MVCNSAHRLNFALRRLMWGSAPPLTVTLSFRAKGRTGGTAPTSFSRADRQGVALPHIGRRSRSGSTRRSRSRIYRAKPQRIYTAKPQRIYTAKPQRIYTAKSQPDLHGEAAA